MSPQSPQSIPNRSQSLSVQDLQRKLISETRALVEISQNFTDMATHGEPDREAHSSERASGMDWLGTELERQRKNLVEAEKDEARSKIQSVINGLQYLKDRI